MVKSALASASASHADMTGALAEILDRDRIQPLHQFFLQGGDKGRDDALAQVGARRLLFLVILDAFGHPHHIADRDAPAFPRQAVAAARARARP